MCINMAKGNSGFDKGGNGANSGLSVTINGYTADYYFSKNGDRNFYQRGIGGTPEPTPQNITAKEFKQRAISNGATVKNITSSEHKKSESEYKAERKAMNDFLDKETASNRSLSQGSRAARKVNRANRRRK